MNCDKPTVFVLEVRPKDDPDGVEPLAWLLVERHIDFRHDSSGVLLKASICVSCQPITEQFSRTDKTKSHFHGAYSCGFGGVVSVTASDVATGGYVLLENRKLQGHRIGTFLMNEVVQWVRQWPDAEVRTVELLAGQAHADNKERRNRFYERFGLKFDFGDLELRSQGCSRPMLAKELNMVDSWRKNITVHSLDEYLENVLYEKKRDALELMQRTRAVKDLAKERRDIELRPIRWALGKLFFHHSPHLLVGAFLTILAAIIWSLH